MNPMNTLHFLSAFHQYDILFSRLAFKYVKTFGLKVSDVPGVVRVFLDLYPPSLTLPSPLLHFKFRQCINDTSKIKQTKLILKKLYQISTN